MADMYNHARPGKTVISATHTRGEWCGPRGKHLTVTVYSRPWWNWFRKTNEIRCWECEVVIREPEVTRG
jgi:hypothetical protein